jgi:beta-glucuronidase
MNTPLQLLDGRQRTPLGGRWRSIVDPYRAGYLTFYGDPWDMGWFANLPMRPGVAEYDWDKADLLQVPGDWNSQDDRLFFYEGSLWYKRDFELAPAADRRQFVHFGAANYEAVVWLNGQQVGRHVGGFTPFAFEVTDAARGGTNELVVMVDNTRHRSAVPMTSTDWWNYGGLTRAVCLVDVPATFVRRYSIQLDAGGRSVSGWVSLDGSDAAGRKVELSIPELGVETSATSDGEGRAEFRLDAEPERWAPGAPRLYDIGIESGDDVVADRVGFRHVETRGHQVLINDEPTFLRGISLHEEAPNRPGRAFGEDDARTLLGWAADLGCNFVRLAHYPHDEATVRLADELGILVWAEIPVYWNIDWENPETLDCAKTQLEELIERDRNRAAVILWSLSNESPASDPRLAFLRALVDHARSLDPTRLLTAALMARPEGEALRIDDPIGEHLDVMGCNEYLGWYYKDLDDVAGVRWSTAYDKPLIMSELGAGAVAGVVGDEKTLFTEAHQARVYTEQIAMMREIPFLAGLSPWILKDFRSPRRVLPGVQDYYNRKGLVSERGQRKRAFAVLQHWYRELAG